jgi:hypothetical protein
MAPVELESTISADGLLQAYALDRAGTGNVSNILPSEVVTQNHTHTHTHTHTPARARTHLNLLIF